MWVAIRVHGRGLMPQRTVTLSGRPAPLRAKVETRDADPPPFPAEWALCRSGYMPFVPTERYEITQPIRRRHRRSKRLIEMMKPLIPGFALLDLPDDPSFNWLRLFSVPYVLGVYGKLKGIPARDIAAVAAMERRLWSNNPYGTEATDTVEVTDGAMRGRTVLVTKVITDVPDAVLVGLAEIFGRPVEIEVPIAVTKRVG